MLYWYAQTEDGGFIAVGAQSQDGKISRIDSVEEVEFHKKTALADSVEVKDSSPVEIYFKKKWIVGYVKSESQDRCGRIMRVFLVSDELTLSKEEFKNRAMRIFDRFSEFSKFEFKEENRGLLEKSLQFCPIKKKIIIGLSVLLLVLILFLIIYLIK